MRIVHLSTYDIDGGAARAASRLHESLLAAGEQSVMLVKTRRCHTPSIEQIAGPTNGEAFFADLVQKWYVDRNRTPLSSTWFSAGSPAVDVSSHPFIQQADLIHLHWVTGLTSPDSLKGLLRLRKPVVWSLHDQRPYTGGCHYTGGCAQFERDCGMCPQLAADPCGLPAANLADQRELAMKGGLTLIAPSRWMALCARRSVVFSKTRIEIVPYGIDIQLFRPLPQTEARARLGLPKAGFLLLFGVDNSREKRKGQRELYQALEACGRSSQFQREPAQGSTSLICFGELDSIPGLPIPVKAFGRVRSDELLSCIYSAADLFLLPSLEDNFPNTVLESLSCGTPVAAFTSGGVPEMIEHGKTGFLTATGNVEGLSEIVLQAALNPERVRRMRPDCRRQVEENFTYDRQAQSCINLYQELRTKPQPPETGEANAKGKETETRFQEIYSRLLMHAFDRANGELSMFGDLAAKEGPGRRRSQFSKQVRRIIHRAVHRGWRYADVQEALDAELKILKGQRALALRGKLLIKRLLAK